MKDGAPFGLGGIWENWKQPSSGEWLRTFATVRSRSRDAAQVWYVASLRTHARLSQCLYRRFHARSDVLLAQRCRSERAKTMLVSLPAGAKDTSQAGVRYEGLRKHDLNQSANIRR